MKLISKFARNESGATAIEYGLIAALIAVGLIIAAGTVGGQLAATFTEIGNELPAATAG